jgi:hypothetical protein
MSLDRVGNGYGMRENEGNRVFSLYFLFFKFENTNGGEKVIGIKKEVQFYEV